MDHSTVEAFASIFRGFSKKFGKYTQQDPKPGKAKLDGEARTIDGPPTIDDFARHLAGNMPSIGIVPLCEDDTVHFGAIDVDKYDLDLEDLAKKIAALPLFLTRSKSSGAHLWCFSEQGIPANVMIAVLQNYSGQLGFAGSEIFPKQATRGGPEDIGNWINLPYFGNSRQCLIYNEDNDTVVELTAEQFVNVVQSYNKATPEQLLEHSQINKKRRARDKNAPLFSDGPPCNVTALIQFANGALDLEGMRNNFMFNIGVYLKRRLDSFSEVEHILHMINRGLFELEHKGEKIRIPAVGLPDKELEKTVIKSLDRKEYNYRCKEQPMCNLCQRAKCKTMTFGVDKNKADLEVEFGALTKVLAEPPYYYMTVGDQRIKFKDSHELITQKTFRAKFLEAANVMLPPMSEPEFAAIISDLVGNDKRIDVLPTAEVNDITHIVLALDTYVKEYKADRLEDVRNQRVFHDFENECYIFVLAHFQAYLKRSKVEFDRQILGDQLKLAVGMEQTNDLGQRLGQINVVGQKVPFSALSQPDLPDREMKKEELVEKEFL